MFNEDKCRFSFLMIVTVIVMMMNIKTMSDADMKGLGTLDAAFDSYLTATARSWADASINQTVQEELDMAEPQIQ